MKHTIVAEDGPYLIQTPHAGIVMGIGEDTSIHLGLATKKDIYEVTDDSYVKPELRKCESRGATLRRPGQPTRCWPKAHIGWRCGWHDG